MNQVWYFTYGNNLDSNKLIKNKIKIYDSKVATLNGFKINNYKPDVNGFSLNTNIIEDPYNVVEGICYLIDETDLIKVDKLEGYNIKPDIQRNLIPVKFRGDKSDIPLKDAYVYAKINNNIPTNFNTIQPITKMKNDIKFFKLESNINKFVKTYETFVFENKNKK